MIKFSVRRIVRALWEMLPELRTWRLTLIYKYLRLITGFQAILCRHWAQKSWQRKIIVICWIRPDRTNYTPVAKSSPFCSVWKIFNLPLAFPVRALLTHFFRFRLAKT